MGVAAIAAGLLGCSSRSPARHESATSPPAVTTVDAGAEWKTFSPRGPKRPVPPDGILRLAKTWSLTAIPELPRRTDDVDGLAALLLAAERVTVDYDAAHPGILGDEVYLWIATKPGRRVYAWITSDRRVTLRDEQALAAQIVVAAPGPVIKERMVVFVVGLTRRASQAPREELPPIPEIWEAFMQGDSEPVETIVERAWPG